ncbi:MAG: hypothetical protein RIR17_2035, partial [Planctomycetota bacterium]
IVGFTLILAEFTPFGISHPISGIISSSVKERRREV